jgi:drug/metabolite transporter (DMT)-like permease
VTQLIGRPRRFRLAALSATFTKGLLSLFIDDKRFALSTVLWVTLVAVLTHWLSFHREAGPLLFLGLAALLFLSVLHFAQKH